MLVFKTQTMEESNNRPAFVKRNAMVVGEEYKNLLSKLKEQYRRSRIKAAVRVNSALLEFYWKMGREISKLYKNANYGSAFFDTLSLDLKSEFPNQTGFSVTNIKYTKRWYEFYGQCNTRYYKSDVEFENNISINRQQVVDDFEMPADFGLVPWNQHIEIFTHSKSVEEALFYIEKTIENGWSHAELSYEMGNGLFIKRGAAVTNFEKKLPEPYCGLAQDILKSPYNFGFIVDKINSERQLEDALANNITRFLLELGQGFAYVGRLSICGYMR